MFSLLPSSQVFRYLNEEVIALTSAGTCVPLLQLLGKALALPRVQPTRMTMAEAIALTSFLLKFITHDSILDAQPALKG